MIDKPGDLYEAFEDYSHDIKLNKYDFKESPLSESTSRIRESYSEVKEHVEKSRKIIEVVY